MSNEEPKEAPKPSVWEPLVSKAMQHYRDTDFGFRDQKPDPWMTEGYVSPQQNLHKLAEGQGVIIEQPSADLNVSEGPSDAPLA
jgi:hypothetical protein